MTPYHRHTIMIKTPAAGGFVRVEGSVQRDFYSYDLAKNSDHIHTIYIDDDIYYVLVDGQNIPYVVAKNLAQKAHSGLVTVVKFIGF